MGVIPSLRAVENSTIDPDQETLEQNIEEIILDNLDQDQLFKLSEYKRRFDDIVVRLNPEETAGLLDKIDLYVEDLKQKEEAMEMDLAEVLLFHFISSENTGLNEDYNIEYYDLPDEDSIERFLIEIIDNYINK